MIYYKADGAIKKSSNPNDLYFGWWLTDLMARSTPDTLEFHDQYYDGTKRKQDPIDGTYLIPNTNLKIKKPIDGDNTPPKTIENFPEGILKKNTLDYTFKGVSVEKKKGSKFFNHDPEVHEKILSLLHPDFIGYEQLEQLVTANKIHWNRLKLYEKLRYSAKSGKTNNGSHKKSGKKRLHRSSNSQPVEGTSFSKISAFPEKSVLNSNFLQERKEDDISGMIKDKNDVILEYPLVSLESPYLNEINEMEKKINNVREDVHEATKRVHILQYSYDLDELHCQNLLEDIRKFSKNLQEERLLNDIIWLLSGELNNISHRNWPFKINTKNGKEKDDANYII